jgi:hypothetical protein
VNGILPFKVSASLCCDLDREVSHAADEEWLLLRVIDTITFYIAFSQLVNCFELVTSECCH